MERGLKNKGVDEYLDEAIDNIRKDRSVTNTLLSDLLLELKKNPTSDTYKNLGLIAAKYVETLQRSNEQLVKISSIIQKKEGVSESLSDEDRNDLFDIIQGSK